MSKKSKPKAKSLSKITEFAAPVTVKADEVLAISGNIGKAVKPKVKSAPVKEITLATLHTFSAQQVFNYVARHLLEQSERSVGKSNSVCRYKTAKGLKCTAGCLISQKEYRTDFEGRNWGAFPGTPEAHFDLISALQQLHDGNFVATWLQDLKSLALDFKLSPSQLAFYFWNAELCRYQHRNWRVVELTALNGIKGMRRTIEGKTFEVIGLPLNPDFPPHLVNCTYLVKEI